MRTRSTIIVLAALLAACYRPSSSITSNPDATAEPRPDPTAEAVEEVAAEPVDEPVVDAEEDPAEEPVIDADEDVEEDVWEESDLGEVPVTFAPDFALEDLNPNSPTYGSMRRLSDQRGKVIVFYIGNYG